METLTVREARRLALARGSFRQAIEPLEAAHAAEPESPEILKDLILATALAGQERVATGLAEEFINLPRLLPKDDIEQMLLRLEEAGLFTLAALIGNRAAERHEDTVALELKARAALDAFRGGDPALIRRLRDDSHLGRTGSR